MPLSKEEVARVLKFIQSSLWHSNINCGTGYDLTVRKGSLTVRIWWWCASEENKGEPFITLYCKLDPEDKEMVIKPSEESPWWDWLRQVIKDVV